MRLVRADGTTGMDETISERHKRWGMDVPCADFDFPVFEFGYGKCVAIIEYKQNRAHPSVLRTKRTQALFTINPSLPTGVVVYNRWDANGEDPEWWSFRIVKGNKALRDSLRSLIGPLDHLIQEWKGVQCVVLSEAQYVRWLYHLRNLPCPQQVTDDLNGVGLPAGVELDWLN